MAKRLIITGTPGTGKTTVADLLSRELNEPVIHVTDYIKANKLSSGTKDGELLVDTARLRKALISEPGILESHLLCEFSLPDAIVIVLRCRPDELAKRMSKRGYSAQKVRENQEAEALDYCTQLAEQHYKKVFEVDTTGKSAAQTAEECLKIIKGRKQKKQTIDFSDFFLQ